MKKARKPKVARPAPIYERIRGILESARAGVARSVNTTQVVANWLIGREIVEEEQRGLKKAGYGQKLIVDLSDKLQAEFGGGFSATIFKLFRQFFLTYPDLLPPEIGHTARGELRIGSGRFRETASGGMTAIGHTACDQSWKAGQLHPNLSWSLYRHLLRVETDSARSFYEVESVTNHWSARELERQINSLLYERLAKSRDKEGLMRLATQGQEIAAPIDAFKDPVIIEFLGLPESPRLVESVLETALIDNLQAFLLELGKGFAFVARQDRITLDGDHFYIDLVFYHTVLKCFVAIDLKIGKMTHADLGQLQLYVNYYDEERRTAGDNPTLGLILCTDKNEAVVRYTLGPQQSQKIFASRYKLHLPTEAELKEEICREVRYLSDVERAKRPTTARRAKKKQ
jgi:predicted nuclease of restriction endonuclease-like (RecB) superfamily